MSLCPNCWLRTVNYELASKYWHHIISMLCMWVTKCGLFWEYVSIASTTFSELHGVCVCVCVNGLRVEFMDHSML